MGKVENADLRAEYQAETAAMRRIEDMKARKKQAALEVLRLTRARDGLAGRMAHGEAVTGADLRKANEALADVEAEVGLLTNALPKAAGAAFEASSARSSVEAGVIMAAHRPYREALEASEAALREAQEARDRARQNLEQLPAAAQEALDELLDRHGRDLKAAREIEEVRRMQQVNESRRLSGQPVFEWP